MTWYDSIADGYDELRGQEQRQKLAVFQPFIDPGMRVLDVGFGTGISDDYLDATIVGLEPSAPMLNEYEGDARTYNAQGAEIPRLFAENAFDATLCVSTAHHFDDAETVFSAITSVVRSQGYVFLSVFENDTNRVLPLLKGVAEVERSHVHRDTVLVYQVY